MKTVANGLKAPDRGSLWVGFEVPATLSPFALAEFDRLVAALGSTGALERTEPSLVLEFARTRDRIEKANAELDSATLTQTTSNATLMPHPMIAVLNTLSMRLKGLLSEMGLTPASAKAGGSKPADDDSPWAGLLKISS